MRVVIFAALAVLSVIGLATAQFGYGYGAAQTGNDSMMTFGAIAVLFIFLLLINTKKSVPLYFGNQSLGVNVQTNVIG